MEKVIQELKQGLESENIPSRPNVENVRFDVIHARIIDALHRFNGAPFTIQRLCELLTDPKRHYKRSDKFMRGLEKNVLVVSTVDPFGRKVVCESSGKHLMNGMDLNGAFPPRDTGLTGLLPPVPGWVNTSSVATTSRTQTPPLESVPDQRIGSLNSRQSPGGVVSNGIMSSGLASSVYADQGEQLSVQTEEVIEETVVTMETNEVSSVTADAGESLQEGDEDEDMVDDRTSSSSSSSSSSEELSSSDSIDSNTQGSISKASATSSVEIDENNQRPWASIAHDGEDKRQMESTKCTSPCQTENQEENSDNTSKDNACSLPTSSTSASYSQPTLFSAESTSSSAAVEQAEVDSAHPPPESSVVESSHAKEATQIDTVFSTYENTSLPNNSISTPVPDSLQSSGASTADSETGQDLFPATSFNPDSQPLSSSSDTDSESDAVNVSAHGGLGGTEHLLECAEPSVSSSSSSCAHPSTIPTSECDNTDAESLDFPQDGAESEPAAWSKDDEDLEPPRKFLKLAKDECVGEEDSSVTTVSDCSGTSSPVHVVDESKDHVHSSVDDLPLTSTDNIAESHTACEADEGNVQDMCEVEAVPGNQDSEASSNNVDEETYKTSPSSMSESKEADMRDEDTAADLNPDLSLEAGEETSEEQMSVG